VSDVLKATPKKLKEGAYSALSGVSYPQLVEMVDRMAAQDPRIVFDSMRPVADELFNFVDGERTAGEIVHAVCMEFGFRLDPEHFVPFIEGMAEKGLIELSHND
jgi:hypothetical protein